MPDRARGGSYGEAAESIVGLPEVWTPDDHIERALCLPVGKPGMPPTRGGAGYMAGVIEVAEGTDQRP